MEHFTGSFFSENRRDLKMLNSRKYSKMTRKIHARLGQFILEKRCEGSSLGTLVSRCRISGNYTTS